MQNDKMPTSLADAVLTPTNRIAIIYNNYNGVIVEQTTCPFSRSIRANDLGKLRSAQCMGRRGL